mmetsp:Transcript_20060/g.65599  ORF Transcript_20060/g.65599 Transcript_20060/m.65599 type:complete len:158 (-) Transcript_20060:402-875(-)
MHCLRRSDGDAAPPPTNQFARQVAGPVRGRGRGRAPALAPRSVSCRPPARGDRAHTVPAGSPPSSPPVGAVRRHVSQNGDRAARAGVLLATTLSPPLRDRRRPRHRRRQHRLAPRASPSPSPPPALDLATASFWGSAGGLPASPPPPQRDRFRSIGV